MARSSSTAKTAVLVAGGALGVLLISTVALGWALSRSLETLSHALDWEVDEEEDLF